MSEFRNQPTCALGFWEPLHEGCPVCGPNGPCLDPDYEAVIQTHAASKRRRRLILALVAALCTIALGVWLS